MTNYSEWTKYNYPNIKSSEITTPLKATFDQLRNATVAEIDQVYETQKTKIQRDLRDSLAAQGTGGSPIAAVLEAEILGDFDKKSAIEKAGATARIDAQYASMLADFGSQMAGMQFQATNKRKEEREKKIELAKQLGAKIQVANQKIAEYQNNWNNKALFGEKKAEAIASWKDVAKMAKQFAMSEPNNQTYQDILERANKHLEYLGEKPPTVGESLNEGVAPDKDKNPAEKKSERDATEKAFAVGADPGLYTLPSGDIKGGEDKYQKNEPVPLPSTTPTSGGGQLGIGNISQVQTVNIGQVREALAGFDASGYVKNAKINNSSQTGG